MSAKSTTALKVENNSTINTNGLNAITGHLHNVMNDDMIDSMVNKVTDINLCRQIECKSNVSIMASGSSIIFTNDIGISGSSYALLISCYDSAGNNVDYKVTLRTNHYFTIYPAINCFIDYSAIKV